jgi:heme/copper-type cytochrome/quinol oxidase subunit 2
MSVRTMARERETTGEAPEPGGLGVGARALNYGASAVLTGVIMVGASLLLWIGVPAGWLWVGSQIEGSSGNIGVAIAVMLIGAVVSIVAIAWVLGNLNRVHEHLREARGAKSHGPPLLEVVLVVTAAVALVAFAIWFFVLAGPGPELAPRS